MAADQPQSALACKKVCHLSREVGETGGTHAEGEARRDELGGDLLVIRRRTARLRFS